ncbi:MAG: type II toxin-antitoxin system RelE family toxin [Promethearchaeota archaeon]
MTQDFISEFPSSFIEDLNKLPESIRKAVDEHIKDIIKKPTIGKRLKQNPLWSDRVGDYRIIYFVDFRERKIQFITVDKRSKVYKRFF